MADWFQEKPDGLYLRIRVQPKASRDGVAGLQEDALKIRLTAPPVEGAANKACLKFLGKLLGVAPSLLDITTGQTGRSKIVRLDCPAADPRRAALVARLRDIPDAR